jgi:hypothetical protein
LERSSADQGRTSPVRLSSFIALDLHAENGGGLGRERSIRRRISANRARGTATRKILELRLWVISEHDALVLSMSAFLWRAVLD